MSVSNDFGAMLQQLAVEFVSASELFGPAWNPLMCLDIPLTQGTFEKDLDPGASRYSRNTSNKFGVRGSMSPCSTLEACILSILPQSILRSITVILLVSHQPFS